VCEISPSGVLAPRIPMQFREYFCFNFSFSFSIELVPSKKSARSGRKHRTCQLSLTGLSLYIPDDRTLRNERYEQLGPKILGINLCETAFHSSKSTVLQLNSAFASRTLNSYQRFMTEGKQISTCNIDTIGEVAGSSSDEVIDFFFNLPNPSSRTVSPGLTPSLTEISTRTCLWGVERG
jgi:hypothetical protein